jgi:hypothetical protein
MKTLQEALEELLERIDGLAEKVAKELDGDDRVQTMAELQEMRDRAEGWLQQLVAGDLESNEVDVARYDPDGMGKAFRGLRRDLANLRAAVMNWRDARILDELFEAPARW